MAGSDDEPTRDNIDACRRCELWEQATQGVSSEGTRHAALPAAA